MEWVNNDGVKFLNETIQNYGYVKDNVILLILFFLY